MRHVFRISAACSATILGVCNFALDATTAAAAATATVTAAAAAGCSTDVVFISFFIVSNALMAARDIFATISAASSATSDASVSAAVNFNFISFSSWCCCSS